MAETNKKCKLLYAINQVLLKHEGPLHEFTLSIDLDDSCDEIDDIFLLLSNKNTVKKVRFEIIWGGYLVPLPLFSMCQLRDLCLIGCVFDVQPPIDGFGSLTNLSLQDVYMSKKTLLHLLSNFPSLKNLEITDSTVHVHEDNDSTIINLIMCLLVIENLSIMSCVVKSFAKDGVPKVLPVALVHLEFLFIEDISFSYSSGLPILLLLIKTSPNLKKLKLQIVVNRRVNDLERRDSFTLEDYSNICLDQLNELEIINFRNKENELDFVKLILANSPMLKKVEYFSTKMLPKRTNRRFHKLFYAPHMHHRWQKSLLKMLRAR